MNPVWKRAARSRLLDVSLALLALACVVRTAAILPSRIYSYDFNHYYVSSRLLLEGRDPYQTSLAPRSAELGFASSEMTETSNPPPLLWLFVPFAALKPEHAFAAWVTVQTCSLGLILWLVRRELQPRLTPRSWRFVCFAALISEAVYWNFYYAHVEILLAAMVLGAYALRRAGKHTCACLTVTAAGLIKLFPFVLLPWFLWRSGDQWRPRVWRTLTVGLFILAVGFATGPALWQGFIQKGLWVVSSWAVGYTFNFSLTSFVINLGYVHHGYHPPLADAKLWWNLGLFAGLLSMVGAYARCARARDREAEFCLLTVAMLAGSLTSWGYYFVFLLFPMVVTALRVGAHPTVQRLFWFALMLAAVNTLSSWQVVLFEGHPLLKLLANYIPLYGLLGVGIFFAGELRKATPSDATDRAGTTSSTPPRP